MKKDPKRAFDDDQKEELYRRQNGKCPECKKSLDIEDVEAHHVKPHAKGGKTVVRNGALVHEDCHPKSDKDVRAFWKKFRSQ